MKKVTDKSLEVLYSNYALMNVEEFRTYCIDLIANAKAPNREIMERMKGMRTKDQILTATNNFALKGFGLGVL